jgi:sulfoxide reductase heme-binding subunit YedZ
VSAGSGSALWYLSRGSGTVTVVLLTGSLVLGIASRSGRAIPGLPRFAVAGLHRNASLLAVLFLAVHVTTAIADSYVPLRLVDAVVPFRAPYHRWEVGLGAVALDLIVVLVATSLLREHLGRRGWRTLHWTSYGCWSAAMVHATLLGPDVLRGRLIWVTVGCLAAAAGALGWRVLAVPSDPVTAARRTRSRVAR